MFEIGCTLPHPQQICLQKREPLLFHQCVFNSKNRCAYLKYPPFREFNFVFLHVNLIRVSPYSQTKKNKIYLHVIGVKLVGFPIKSHAVPRCCTKVTKIRSLEKRKIKDHEKYWIQNDRTYSISQQTRYYHQEGRHLGWCSEWGLVSFE